MSKRHQSHGSNTIVINQSASAAAAPPIDDAYYYEADQASVEDGEAPIDNVDDGTLQVPEYDSESDWTEAESEVDYDEDDDDGEDTSFLKQRRMRRNAKRLAAKEGERGLAANLSLLDDALEDMGCKKYQNRVLAVAFLAMFADHTESAMQSLLFLEFQKDWNSSAEQLALISSLSSVGAMAGALTLGVVADRYGRTYAFGAILSVCLLVGMISSFSTSVAFFAICRLFISFSASGAGVICNALLLETTPNSRRAQYILFTSLAFGAAHLVMGLLAWLLFPLIGWRWVTRISAAFFIPVAFIFSSITESPRFYLVKGNNKETMRVVEHIARTNKVVVPDYISVYSLESNYSASTSQKVKRREERTTCYKSITRTLRQSRNIRVMIPLLITWGLLGMGNSFMPFIPLELKKHIKGSSVPFTTTIIGSIAGITATLGTVLVVRRIARRSLIQIGLFGTSLSIFLLSLSSHLFTIFLAIACLNVFLHVAMSVMYVYSPELFQTKYRVTAFGVCIFGYRIIHSAVPFLTGWIVEKPFWVAGIVFGIVYMLAILPLFALERGTPNDSLYEGEPDEISGPSEPISPGLVEAPQHVDSKENNASNSTASSPGSCSTNSSFDSFGAASLPPPALTPTVTGPPPGQLAAADSFGDFEI